MKRVLKLRYLILGLMCLMYFITYIDRVKGPLLVIQGGADDVVAPINAVQLVRQYLALNGHPAADSDQSGGAM